MESFSAIDLMEDYDISVVYVSFGRWKAYVPATLSLSGIAYGGSPEEAVMALMDKLKGME